MARYIGPSTRISRRFGQLVIGSAKALERRNYPPGQHGPKSRRKASEYAVGLNEKQKLRYMYGLLERQFRRVFEIAKRERGVTGERFLQLLDTRLDSVIYLLGPATRSTCATRPPPARWPPATSRRTGSGPSRAGSRSTPSSSRPAWSASRSATRWTRT